MALEDMKEIQLGMLDVVHSFCEENGIRYSLYGGTLLGAVRHQGYIPWDDDIDIIMPRPDYDRFVKTFSHEGWSVIDLNTKDYCVESFTKLSLDGTVMRDRKLGREMWGVNIDVMPLEGIPLDKEDYYKIVCSRKHRIARICRFYKVVNVRKALWYVKYLVKAAACFYSHNVISHKQCLEEYLRKHDFETCPYAGDVQAGYGIREWLPTEVYKEFVLMPFEGRMVSCFKDYDAYLTANYGDYLKLPPEDKRKTPHDYDTYYL